MQILNLLIHEYIVFVCQYYYHKSRKAVCNRCNVVSNDTNAWNHLVWSAGNGHHTGYIAHGNSESEIKKKRTQE